MQKKIKSFLYNKKYKKRSLAEWDCKDCGFIRPLHNYNYPVLRNESDLCGNHYRFGDLTADIQSVAIYMESNLQISILEYIIYSVLTKGFVFFATGTVIMAFCIFADRIVLPYVAAFLLYGISYIAYLTIPAVENGLYSNTLI